MKWEHAKLKDCFLPFKSSLCTSLAGPTIIDLSLLVTIRIRKIPHTFTVNKFNHWITGGWLNSSITQVLMKP